MADHDGHTINLGREAADLAPPAVGITADIDPARLFRMYAAELERLRVWNDRLLTIIQMACHDLDGCHHAGADRLRDALDALEADRG